MLFMYYPCIMLSLLQSKHHHQISHTTLGAFLCALLPSGTAVPPDLLRPARLRNAEGALSRRGSLGARPALLCDARGCGECLPPPRPQAPPGPPHVVAGRPGRVGRLSSPRLGARDAAGRPYRRERRWRPFLAEAGARRACGWRRAGRGGQAGYHRLVLLALV